MSQATDDSLYRRAVELLKPGDVTLHGAVVHTGFANDEEALLHQATLEIGDVVAEHADAGDTYVYSGNDDPDFGVNQHHGLTVEGDEFVWECQQLFREGTYDVVIYWEATEGFADILADLRDSGYEAVGVTEEGFGPEAVADA
ncbi:MAG: DUF5778 family protein [Halobacteriaceae archaeon]